MWHSSICIWCQGTLLYYLILMASRAYPWGSNKTLTDTAGILKLLQPPMHSKRPGFKLGTCLRAHLSSFQRPWKVVAIFAAHLSTSIFQRGAFACTYSPNYAAATQRNGPWWPGGLVFNKWSWSATNGARVLNRLPPPGHCTDSGLNPEPPAVFSVQEAYLFCNFGRGEGFRFSYN